MYSNTDPIEPILREMEESLERLERGAQESLDDSRNAVDSCHSVRDAIYMPRRGVWNRLRAQHELSLAAVSRTHDTEVVLSKSYARSLIAGFTPTPISIVVGAISLELTPIGAPGLDWGVGSRDTLPADTLEMSVRWRLESTISESRLLTQRFRFRATLGADQDEVQFLLAAVSEFSDVFGDKVDPFEIIPMQGGQRRTARNEMHGSLAGILAAQAVAVPNLDLLGSGSPTRPHAVLVYMNQMLLSARTLEKRRASYPLAGYMTWGTDIGVRVKRELVEPLLHDKINELDIDVDRLTLEEISFHRGYLTTRIHAHEHHKQSYIDVYVDVWMEHYIRIRQLSYAKLSADASWRRWEYKMKSPNCFPVCDRVKREAWDRTKGEIESAKYMTIEFADLSAFAKRAECEPEPYGLYFMLQV